MKYQVISTTDGQFIGQITDDLETIVLNGVVFEADKSAHLSGGMHRVSNSNYVIDLIEVN